jgi:1,4-dihydroxy-2-naphthoate octaprenyltransferase
MSTTPATPVTPSPGTPSLAAVFVEAARPKTLPAGLAPVVLGAAYAATMGHTHVGAVIAAVVGALSIQIGTNYANDYFDNEKGADTDARVGPRRATQAGLVTPATMRTAFIAAFAVAVAAGTFLVWRAGWPIVVVGVASVACGILYTGGPKPLGYLGLGDVFVFVFFGPVAVAGTFGVQSLTFEPQAALLGVSPGLLSVAILVVNNLRDRHTDVAANKRTLAVRFGATFARVEYTVAVAFGIVVVAFMTSSLGPAGLLPLLALPMALSLTRQVWSTDGPALNPLLGKTAKLLLLTTALSVAGMAGPPWPTP